MSSSYSVIHRMTISSKHRDNGIAEKVFKLAEELTHSKGIDVMRIDTDNSNKKMKHLIKKMGDYYCGNIISADGGKRLAYEKNIKKYKKVLTN